MDKLTRERFGRVPWAESGRPLVETVGVGGPDTVEAAGLRRAVLAEALQVDVRQWSDDLYATYLLAPGDSWGSYVGMAESPELAAALGADMRAMPLCGCGHAEWAHVYGKRDEGRVRTWCSHYESTGACDCKSFVQSSSQST